KRVVRELFELYVAEPQCLPTEWAKLCEGRHEAGKALTVGDFIAGMTDRYALAEHARLFNIEVRD
ncbi:MAG: deoxyguanosinetriphosphate triphosphohydrolase, partial [Alphaproteobacteria bacterium]|nr:deoxyguanosinetriphosphate triphosphohydrolase [Alphaproteobacteria bacterium]